MEKILEDAITALAAQSGLDHHVKQCKECQGTHHVCKTGYAILLNARKLREKVLLEYRVKNS